MIYYLPHNKIDKNKWDECIASAHNGLIYSYSWYLDMVAENWDALVIDDYSSVFPLVFNIKYGVKYLYLPPFTQQLGLFSKINIDEEKLNLFINSIPVSFKYGEINLNTHNKIVNTKLDVISNITHHLYLNNDIEIIRKNYSENLKRNIKKAIKNKIIITQNVSPESIINLFRKNKGLNISNLKDKDFDILRNIIHTCIFSGRATCLGAFNEENQLCAGAFFLNSNDKSIFLFSGLNNIGRETGAMAFLIDSHLESISKKIKIFDFEGSNNNNLARFYKSFGSKEQVYQRVNVNRLPLFFKPIIKIYKFFK